MKTKRPLCIQGEDGRDGFGFPGPKGRKVSVYMYFKYVVGMSFSNCILLRQMCTFIVG